MSMQTTHHSTTQPEESAPAHRQFKTREQELYETDRAAWVQELLEWPILGAVYREARSAARQTPASRVFFAHYVAFFREAALMQLPVEGELLTEWFALAFEGAYDFARQNLEQVEGWLDEFPSERHLAEEKLRIFKKQTRQPDQGAHAFINLVVQSGHFDGQPAQENGVTTSSLIAGVEVFFWTGLLAATEARHDPEALDLVEWFDKASVVGWNDGRDHAQLIRKAPRCGRPWSCEFLKHPLLRIAEERYRHSPHEGSAIGGLLEQLCLRSEIKSEKQIIWRDLSLAQWVRDAAQWSAWFLRERPDEARQMFALTDAFAGDRLSRFYRRVLNGVDDINDFVEVTLAFLSWQSEQRCAVTTRYYGESLETIVECVDAGVWLAWWLAQETPHHG